MTRSTNSLRNGIVAVVAVGLASLYFSLNSNRGRYNRRRLNNNALQNIRNAETKMQTISETDGKPSIPMGWKTIHVFYGDERHLPVPKTQPRWQSQAAQDRLVLGLLEGKEDGYFIDLAANDAVRISNTYGLEQSGWKGICIEPNPRYWHHLSYRKCHVVAAMVGGTTMQEVDVTFPSLGAVGGIVGKDFDNKPNRSGVTEKRYTVALLDVLNMFQVPHCIDYLSLDVEGAEELIMMEFPFDKWRISLMSVERPTQNLKNLLQKNGFIFLRMLTNYGETLWAHESLGLKPDDVNRVIQKYNITAPHLM